MGVPLVCDDLFVDWGRRLRCTIGRGGWNDRVLGLVYTSHSPDSLARDLVFAASATPGTMRDAQSFAPSSTQPPSGRTGFPPIRSDRSCCPSWYFGGKR